MSLFIGESARLRSGAGASIVFELGRFAIHAYPNGLDRRYLETLSAYEVPP